MSASATDSISLSLVQNKRLEDSANLPDPDIIAAEIDSQISRCSPMSAVPTTSIVEDLQAALAQLKLARCSHSLTASLAALPSMFLIPFAPFAEIAADLKR